MSRDDRRFGFRVPVDLFVDQYVDDRRYRVLATNLSETGMFVHRTAPAGAPETQSVALEITLPGDAESIWARGEIRFGRSGEFCEETGIKFTGIAKAHARRLRDFCVESRREHLGGLLAAIAA